VLPAADERQPEPKDVIIVREALGSVHVTGSLRSIRILITAK